MSPAFSRAFALYLADRAGHPPTPARTSRVMPPSLRELADRLRKSMPRTVDMASAGSLEAEAILRVADARMLGAERARIDLGGDLPENPAEALTAEIGVAGMTLLIDCAPAAHWLEAYDRGYSDAIVAINRESNT